MFSACKHFSQKEHPQVAAVKPPAILSIVDTIAIEPFFLKHPAFAAYKPQVKRLYQKQSNYIWFKENHLVEFAQVLFNQVKQLDSEGIGVPLPYEQDFDEIFYSDLANNDLLTSELLISCLYFYYVKNVYEGIDAAKSTDLEWYLPRERVSYESLLDTLLLKPGLLNTERPEFFSQYYNLRKALVKFKKIEKNGDWKPIEFPKGTAILKPGDTSRTLAQVRTRLFVEGYLAADSGSPRFDDALVEALANYQQRHNRPADSTISTSVIDELNIPVGERIKTIAVNMERCRWITPKLINAKEFIAVNIPSYRLHYIRNGKPILISNVVVGSELNKTVVFSGELSYLVFNPYWNVPETIMRDEVLPAMQKEPGYLARHNMEWSGERLRQKPGETNSLGLVKFMFPNSNNIYLHDTPAKALFKRDQRAFSHGCIRVEKAKELAIEILREDAGWDEKKVILQMDGKTEKSVKLKNKIPVYIAYFTAWADEQGNVSFYKDIYRRDADLAQLLHL